MSQSGIEVLYEDEVLLAVNKPAGMVMHPGRSRAADLQTAVEEQIGREVIVFHRLDKDTTGVVLLGKRRSINAAMTQAFENKRIRKAYWAVVAGRWQPQWNRIETRIARGHDGRWRNVAAGGRHAVSTCRLLAVTDARSWIEILPKTGRTHQIRLHCVAMGHPVLGDRLYGERSEFPMALHAWRVDLRHPLTGMPLQVRAAPPAYWGKHWLAGLPVDPVLGSLISALAGR